MGAHCSGSVFASQETHEDFVVSATGALNAPPQEFILGQRIDSRYRTNVGIVNLDNVTGDSWSSLAFPLSTP